MRPCAGTMSFEHSIGVSVRATTPEKKIAAASVIGLVFLRLPAVVSLVAAAAAIAAPFYLRSPAFDAPWLWWVGLSETLPRSNDYVPLLPWMGVVWWGLATGRWVCANRPGWLGGSGQGGAPGRFMALWGRWSLSYYLLHQPVLMGVVGLAKAALGSP